MKEITMLQEGNVKITDQRLLIGTESYGISNIRSVQRTKQTRSKKTICMDRGQNFAGAVWYSFQWIIRRVLWPWNLNHDRSNPCIPAGAVSIYDSN